MWFQYPGTIDDEDNEKLFDGFDGTTSDDQPDNVAHHPLNGTKNIINNEKTISNSSNTPSHLETSVIVKKQNVIDFSRNLTNLNRESNDLLQRLLEKNPQYRLKSLLALKRIAIFKNFNFKDVEERKVNSTILKLVSNIIAVWVRGFLSIGDWWFWMRMARFSLTYLVSLHLWQMWLQFFTFYKDFIVNVLENYAICYSSVLGGMSIWF